MNKVGIQLGYGSRGRLILELPVYGLRRWLAPLLNERGQQNDIKRKYANSFHRFFPCGFGFRSCQGSLANSGRSILAYSKGIDSGTGRVI